LGRKIPRHPRSSPSPIHFLPKTKSTPQPSRIIPVPISSPSKFSRELHTSDRRRAASSGAAAGGEGEAEHLTGGRGWILPSRSSLDRSRSWSPTSAAIYCGSSPVTSLLSAFLFYPRLTAACPHHILHVSRTNLL
jgi:hypothetical protein